MKFITLLTTLLVTSAFAKGRITEDRVLTEPTQFGEVLIAPGTIRVFKDNGDLAQGLLAKEQNLHGIVFKSGTKVTIPDYPLSMNRHEMILESDAEMTVNNMPFGTWMSFTENPQTDLTEVMTNLVKPAHLLGVDLAPVGYFRYQCIYNDCARVSRLVDFTLAQDLLFQGIPVPAGSRIDTSRFNVELRLSRDVEAQGLSLKGNNEASVYLNQFGRVIQFNAGRTFTYRGIEIPAGYFVRLDHDGKVLQVGNQTFP